MPFDWVSSISNGWLISRPRSAACNGSKLLYQCSCIFTVFLPLSLIITAAGWWWIEINHRPIESRWAFRISLHTTIGFLRVSQNGFHFYHPVPDCLGWDDRIQGTAVVCYWSTRIKYASRWFCVHIGGWQESGLVIHCRTAVQDFQFCVEQDEIWQGGIEPSLREQYFPAYSSTIC